ncbi:MAG: CPBP family intramembrane metalloprotease [Actinobacteria bacterium]|nr:CPBP family intramembrane metalloprotease [Actinomycetota bacterium]
MSTVADAASRQASPQEGLLACHPLTSFFILSYALTWLAWSPWFLSEAGVGLLPYNGGNISFYVNIAGLILGPALSAFIMTGATEGRAGVRRLLRRIVLWRVGFQWYLFVLLGIPAIMLVSTVVMPGALASFKAAAVSSELLLFVVAFPYVLFATGPFFEEIGWRGFALPRLQRLHGPLVGSLILGTLWALWHLPLFLIPAWDTPHGSPLDVALFVIFVVAMTVVLTWIFNNTKGSLLLAILAHTSVNISTAIVYDLFPAPSVTGGITNFVVGLGVAALVIVVLTRGHLSYRQEDPDETSAPEGRGSGRITPT